MGQNSTQKPQPLQRSIVTKTEPLAIDAEEKISRWNGAAETLFGWSKSEVLGRHLPFELAARPGERLLLHQEAPRPGEPVTFEAVRRKKGGAS